MLTGGLLIWAVHFMGVYLISSTADVVAYAEAPLWRLIGVGFSLACLAAEGLVVLAALKTPAGFERAIAVGGCCIGGIGIVFQTLPLILV